MTASFDDIEMYSVTTYRYLNQGEWWKPKERDPIRVVDMGDRWRGNAVRWMERRASYFETLYTFGEVFSLKFPVGHEVLGVDEYGHDVLGRTLTGHDLMSESAADDMAAWQEERSADPVAWIRTTTLHKALLAAGILDIKVKAAVDDRS